MDATLAVLVTAGIVLGAYCAREAWRGRDALPVLAFLGGVVALPLEPFWDVNVLFLFPFNTEPTAFTAFGRPIPLYVAAVYPAFLGWGSYQAYRLIRRGATTRQLLLVPAAFFVADAMIEIAGTKAGVWLYYGNQPFTVWGWPMYFGVLNGMIPLLGGWALALLEPRLRGPGRAGFVFVVPSAYAAIYAAAGWPTWCALNTDVPRIVIWAAGLLTMSICAGIAWLVATAATAGAARQPPDRFSGVRRPFAAASAIQHQP
jgi:hypothetical protein